MRSCCTASRHGNLGKSQLTIGNSLSGKYPAIRRASSNVYFSLLCQCSFNNANLIIICELIIRNTEVLIYIPICIRFSIKCVIYNIVTITHYILNIISFIFTIMSTIVIKDHRSILRSSLTVLNYSTKLKCVCEQYIRGIICCIFLP